MTNVDLGLAKRLPDPAKKSFIKLVAHPYEGNASGCEPIGTKILVMTDWVDANTASGLITMPADVVERMSLAVTQGTIVAVGGAAFTDWPNSDRAWPGLVPKAGDRVEIAKYAGLLIEGSDGRHYRLCQDTDVAGIKTQEKS
jgi:co-chaperonin GroES (HSP10)